MKMRNRRARAYQSFLKVPTGILPSSVIGRTMRRAMRLQLFNLMSGFYISNIGWPYLSFLNTHPYRKMQHAGIVQPHVEIAALMYLRRCPHRYLTLLGDKTTIEIKDHPHWYAMPTDGCLPIYRKKIYSGRILTRQYMSSRYYARRLVDHGHRRYLDDLYWKRIWDEQDQQSSARLLGTCEVLKPGVKNEGTSQWPRVVLIHSKNNFRGPTFSREAYSYMP